MKFRIKSAKAKEVNARQSAELEKLSQSIATLEAENAQLRARPTEVKINEDPSPTSESRRSANYTAYERDLGAFQS
jgi:cell division protein FtsB